MSTLPSGAYAAGCPLPEDRFCSIGTCPTTGKELTLCYQALGDPSKPCLLLVNGLETTLLGWREDFCQKLADAGFYVVRYDNRDVGLSTHLDTFEPPSIVRMALPRWLSFGEGEPAYTLEDMATDGLQLLTALGIERAHVLGTSMGGMIVQCMAIAHPERLLSCTIVFSHAGGPNRESQSMRMSLSFLSSPKSQEINDLADFKVKQSKLFLGSYTQDDDEVRKIALCSLGRAPSDGPAIMRQIWAIQRQSSREGALKALPSDGSLPVLIIHGDQDDMIPPSNGRRLHKLIESSKLVMFPGMGHSLPRPLFDDIVSEVAKHLSS